MQSDRDDDAWKGGDRLTAATLGLGAFLANFDVTSVVVALPMIGKDLGFTVDGLAWIIDAYSIAFTATLLVAGAVADRFGRRRSLMFGNASFCVASLACGAAWTSSLFLMARVAQGCGAAFLVTGAIASVATAFPAANARVRALGIVGVVSGIAMASGPSLGGLIGSGPGWRWIFLANLPICLLIARAVPRFVAEMRDETEKPLDWPGVTMLTAALALIIDAMLAARHSLWRLIFELLAGLALVALFVVRQRRQSRPMLDPAIFASTPMIGIALLLMAVSAGYWAVLVYLPLYLNASLGWPARESGLASLVATVPMLVVPPFGSRVAVRLGWRRLFATALILIAIGGCALAVAALLESRLFVVCWAFGGMFLIGLGAALSHPQLSGAAVALAPPAASGMASAVTVIARQAGFAISVALLGALTPSDLSASGFIWLFGFAACAAICGAFASRMLPVPSG